MDMGRVGQSKVKGRMIGIYKWGWGDGSETIAFWGWEESFSNPDAAAPAVVTDALRAAYVLSHGASGVVMDKVPACSSADDFKAKTSQAVFLTKTVFWERGVKSVKWAGVYSPDQTGAVPRAVSGGVFPMKAGRADAGVKTSDQGEKAKIVKR